MTPGSRIVAAMYAMPPSTRSSPTSRRRMSGASTPFWNGTTTPPFASSGAICLAAASTSHSFTQNIATSHGGIAAMSSVNVRIGDRRVACAAFDDEPALAQRGQVLAAREERDLVARLRKAAAEVAADAARADDRDSQALPSR